LGWRRAKDWRKFLPMSRFALALWLAAALSAAPALASTPQPGRYRVAEGPDVAGELLIGANHTFQYALAAGALDEQAKGSWYRKGAQICLRTEPKPVPAQFALALAKTTQEHTLLVTWPNGEGIPGVDFRIGFDSGDPLADYTQYYGWSMPQDDTRAPRWIELAIPMHQLVSQRIALDGRKTIRVVLTPNDLGTVDFQGACLEAQGDGFVLHREGGDMRLTRGH
jgi:hypothetical protein